MELLTIGEFARASRLSAKALRLYDELGLLRLSSIPAAGIGGTSRVSLSGPGWWRG